MENTTDRNTSNARRLVPEFTQLRGEALLPVSIGGSALSLKDFEDKFSIRYGLWRKAEAAINASDGLLDSGSHPLLDRLHLLNSFMRYAERHQSGQQVFRPKQFDVFQSARDALERGDTELTIQAPPGFGKTVIFNQMVAATDVPTLIVVPSRKLVEQTYKTFKERSPEVEVGRVSTDQKELGKQVTITTYASLSLDKDGKLIHPEGVRLVILDEVHEGASQRRIERMEAVEHFGDAVIMGFSATPVEIRDDRYEHTRVAKMSKNIVHKIDDREAVEEGYLSPFTAMLVEVDTDLSNVKTTASGDYDPEELDKKINTAAQNKATLELFLAVRDRDQKQREEAGKPTRPLSTIIFANSVKHAQQLAREFEEAGVKAAAVWGVDAKSEKAMIDQALQDLAEGEIEVVFSRDLLIQGVDIPEVRFVLNSAPTTSEIDEKQRCGRALRLDPTDPEKHAIIADMIYKNQKRKRRQVTFPDLMDSSKIVRTTVGTPAEKRPRSGPGIGGLEDIDVPGLKVIVNTEEVMKVVKKMREEVLTPAPEGWIHANGIQEILGKTVFWVNARIPEVLAELQKRDQEAGITRTYGQKFLDKGGKPVDYYSPEVIAQLRTLAEEVSSRAPDGWLSVYGIRAETGKAILWLYTQIDTIRGQLQLEAEERGELGEISASQEFLDSSGQRIVYFSPEVVERVKKIIEQLPPPAPDGWLSWNALVIATGKSSGWVKKRLAVAEADIAKKEEGLAPELRTGNKGTFLIENNIPRELYSPEIANVVIQAAKTEPESAPTGWMMVREIALHVGKSTVWVGNRLEQVASKLDKDSEGDQEKAETVGQYKSKTGRVISYYSPAVIEELRKLAQP